MKKRRNKIKVATDWNYSNYREAYQQDKDAGIIFLEICRDSVWHVFVLTVSEARELVSAVQGKIEQVEPTVPK
ncbi:hypothetical protein D1872_50980 [compost metagenome]